MILHIVLTLPLLTSSIHYPPNPKYINFAFLEEITIIYKLGSTYKWLPIAIFQKYIHSDVK